MNADQARVVVIDGGITGCSVAYHLALAGWTDVLLPTLAEGCVLEVDVFDGRIPAVISAAVLVDPHGERMRG